MRRFVITALMLLFTTVGIAQNTRIVRGLVQNSEGRPLVGAVVKAVDEDSTVQSTQGGAFEIRVSPYCKYLEASSEGYISAQAEIDGSMIIFRLKFDKKYAEMKAKAEEEARLAVEREAAAKAKAQEEARLAVEREAAAKAKAQEEARLAVEREAAAKAKAQEKAHIIAEKRAEVKKRRESKNKAIQITETMKKGYAQYLQLGYSFNMLAYNHSAQLHYIGGYRFNKNLFLGIGTGVNLNNNSLRNSIEYLYGSRVEYDARTYFSLITIPVYAHFRTDFARGRAANPYVSLSIGSEIKTQTVVYNGAKSPVYNHIPLYGELAIGANCRLTQKCDMYFGVSVGSGTGLHYYTQFYERSYINPDNNLESRYEVGYWHSTGMGWLSMNFKFNIGFSF